MKDRSGIALPHFVMALLIAVVTGVNPELGVASSAFDGVDLFELSLMDLRKIRVVTASRYQEEVLQAPAVMTVIEAEEINRFGANSVYEVLERVAGVYMTGSFFFPQNVTSIRGDWLTHADNHVLLMLNGQPLRESYSGGINFPLYLAFPLQSLARIEVIRGPGSVLYGSNAFAGVINLITREGGNNRLTLRAGSGSFDSARFDVGLDWHDEEQSLNASVFQFKETGWPFSAQDNSGVLGSMDYGENNLGAHLHYNRGAWRSDFLYVHSEQDFWGATANWSGLPLPAARTVSAERWFAGVQHRLEQADGWWLENQLNYGRMQFEHYNYDTHSDDLQVGLVQHWQPTERWHGIFGVGAWWQSIGSDAGFQPAPVADTDTSRQDVFTQIDYRFDAWKLTAGVQHNRNRRSGNHTVPRFGATWEWTENAGIKLMYATAYRAAYGTETDFLTILRAPDGSIRGGLRGNPALVPETVTTADLQWYHVGENHSFAATVFRSKEEDLITRVRAADNVIDFVNQGELRLQGYELESKYQWRAETWFTASYSEQRNELSNGRDDFTTIPRRQLKLGIDVPLWQAGQLAMFVQRVSAAGDIAVRNPARRSFNPLPDAYTLVSLNWRFALHQLWPATISKSAQLQLYVYNLLDESVNQPDIGGQMLQSIPARAGRSAYLSLSTQF